MGNPNPLLKGWECLLALAAGLFLAGCSAAGPMPGLIYTHIRYPLTWDVNAAPVPQDEPKAAKIIEIREPISGLGINARLKSNAIGEIARTHGIEKLYFADQERFSILGIWTSHRVILYGE